MLRPFFAIGCLAVASLAVTGCVEQQGAQTPTGAGLPKWEGRAREVFDDNIDPAALGLSLEGPAPRADRFLRERAQTADVVGYMRVNTITVDTVGDAKRYHFGVQVAMPTLAKPRIEDRAFELELGAGNAILGAGFESRLRGHTFIGFVHRYTNDVGEPMVHWHLSADTPDVVAAVKEALALREFSGT